jgi:16S rRNA processing protein RimM
MPNYVNIGKLVATFGVKGEMILKHNLGKKTGLKGLDVFFLEDLPGSFLPYFPVSLKIKSESELFVMIDGMDSKEKASGLLQQQVWVTEDVFKKFAAATAPIALLGYVAHDKGKALGEVLEVIEQPHQVMCRIQFGKHDDILIPINEQSLVKVDKKNKKLMLDLPDGLIEAQI